MKIRIRLFSYLVLVSFLVVLDWGTKFLYAPPDGEGVHIFLRLEAEAKILLVPVAIFFFLMAIVREDWYLPVRIVASLLFAASVGNLIDAILDLQVVNFIPIWITDARYWFNIADIYLVLAFVLIVSDILFLRHLRN